MIIIEYNPNSGTPVRDGDAKMEAEAIILAQSLDPFLALRDVNNSNTYASYANEYVFYHLRLAMLEGKIDYRTVLFRYDGKDIPLNEYAVPTIWVVGFLDGTAKLAQKLILGGISMRRAKQDKEAIRCEED